MLRNEVPVIAQLIIPAALGGSFAGHRWVDLPGKSYVSASCISVDDVYPHLRDHVTSHHARWAGVTSFSMSE